MGIVTILAAAIAVIAGTTAAVLASRERSARRDLVTARTENEKLTVRLAQVEADQRTAEELRQELADVRTGLTTERDDALAALTDEQRQRADLDTALAEARTRRTELDGELLEEHRRRTEVEAELEQARKELAEATNALEVHETAVAGRANPNARESDGCWALLLADVERRWAAVVGAPPDEGGVHLGAVDRQLEEALGRETERLREEVGVDISLSSQTSLEPGDPVLFLLAATDLLGVLATNCQKVGIDADASLTLTGEEWFGPTDDLEAARDRVQAAGAAVDELHIESTVDVEPGTDTSAEDGPRLKTPARYRVQVALHPT